MRERQDTEAMATETNSPAVQVCSLFQQPWWLDAVAPGQWQTAEVWEGNELCARMPYVTQRRYGMSCVVMPSLTQVLGPWMAQTGCKRTQSLAKEKKWLAALLDQLPPFDYFCQSWHYSMRNWLPFYWQGFSCTPRYTYAIDNLEDMDAIWQDFHGSVRTDVRKAEKQLAVRTDLSFEEFWRLNELTFRRQGKSVPYSQELVRRLDAALRDRDQRKIFFAEDAQGRLHAALYLVWDEHSAYYLMGGSDPELRSSGAMSLLMWAAIRFSATVTRKFDFEGSMIEPVERFVSSFGGEQKVYFVLRKYSRRMNVVQALRSLCRRGAA